MSVSNPALDQPLAQWEEVEVTFPSAANTDLQIATGLTPPVNLEGINYVALRKDRAADIYHDTSATRKPWQRGSIFLRSTVASARVRLLLYVPHAGQTPFSF